MLQITNDSHTDHNISQEILAYLLQKYAEKEGFFIDSFELPEHLGTVPCGLHGPAVGDAPVPDGECILEVRGDRGWPSRLCAREPRPTRTVTVIAGPHGEQPCVLYTVFGGPLAPKEPGDTSLDDAGRAESEAFWGQHALSI